MAKSKSYDSGKPAKVKSEKKYTRATAEKAMSAGTDPSRFEKHSNYHVRCKAWKKMGRPLPESEKDVNALLVTLQGKPFPKDASPEEQATFTLALRHKFLGEE